MPELVLNDLFTQERPDGKTAWLTRPLILLSPALQGIVIVPSGFLTDYASHPFRTARGEYNRAAVGHDWLYEAQTIVRLVNGVPAIGDVARAEADLAFREWMADLGTGLIQRNTFYAAVRVGGWLPWSRPDRTEHRRYGYGNSGWEWPLSETLFGYPAEGWLSALDCYAQSFPRHREF